MKLFRILILVCVFFSFLSCSKETTSNNDIPTYEETGVIDEGGGIVHITDEQNILNGTYVNIPEGALENSVEITISQIEDFTFIDTMAIVVDFAPSGTQFTDLVEIGIPCPEGINPETLQIYTYNEDKQYWETIPIYDYNPETNIAITKITHFSWYVVGEFGSFYNIELYKVDSNRLAMYIQSPILQDIGVNAATTIATGRFNMQEIFEYVSIHQFYAWHKIYITEDTWFFPEEYQFEWHYYGGDEPTGFSFKPTIVKMDDGEIYRHSNWVNNNDNLVQDFFRGEAYVFISDPLPTNEDLRLELVHYYSSSSDPAYSDDFIHRYTENYGFTIKDISLNDLSQLPTSIDYNQNGITNTFDPEQGNQPPNPPSNPNPSDNATSVSIDTDLSWDCTDPEGNDLTYDVYFGTSPNPPLENSGQSGNIFDLNDLSYDIENETTYYWKIKAHDNHDNSTSGDIWGFTTAGSGSQPPNPPSNPLPPHNATSVSINTDLSWECTDPNGDPLTFDVYFGTSSNPPLLEQDLTQSSYDLTELDPEETYYWKIMAHDDHSNFTIGDIWNFSTSESIPPTEMIFVQGGTYEMGDHYYEGDSDELPVHTVTLSDFYIGECEVTQSEYEAVMGNNPASLLGVGDNYPVYYVSWYDAVTFCNSKSQQEGLTPCYNLNDWSCNYSTNGYRLPTEAEWEYAARGGVNWTDDFRYSGCHEYIDFPNYAWYIINAGGQTNPVGTKLPNQLMIYDLSGNVWEWCNDWYSSDSINPPNYYQTCYTQGTVDNPTGPTNGSYRVIRSGGFDHLHPSCRSASRLYASSGYIGGSGYTCGFRIVRAL